MSNASVLHSPPPAFASADQQTIFIRAFYLHGVTKKMGLTEGVKKKSCNIVTTYVGGRTGNYTKFIYFFHGPNSSKSAKKIFLLGG